MVVSVLAPPVFRVFVIQLTEVLLGASDVPSIHRAPCVFTKKITISSVWPDRTLQPSDESVFEKQDTEEDNLSSQQR